MKIYLKNFELKEEENKITEELNQMNLIQNKLNKKKNIQKIKKNQLNNKIENFYKKKKMNLSHIKNKKGIYENEKDDSSKIRFVSKNILRNEGIEKSRAYQKRVAIPRLKQKLRYKKAMNKMISQGNVKKAENSEIYEGERRGIKIGKSSHVNLK